MNELTLKMASFNKDEVMMADIDLFLARDKMVTTQNHIMEDRIRSEYGELIN